MKKHKIAELNPIIAAVLGLMFISTALIAYSESFQYIYELTFLSNTSAGLFLLISAALGRKYKR